MCLTELNNRSNKDMYGLLIGSIAIVVGIVTGQLEIIVLGLLVLAGITLIEG